MATKTQSAQSYKDKFVAEINKLEPQEKKNWSTAARVLYDSANCVLRKVCEIERQKGLDDLPAEDILLREDFTDLAKCLNDLDRFNLKTPNQMGSFFEARLLFQARLKKLDEPYKHHYGGSDRNAVRLEPIVANSDSVEFPSHVVCIDGGSKFSLTNCGGGDSKYYQKRSRDKKACTVNVYRCTDAWAAVQDLEDMRDAIIGHPPSASLNDIQKVFDDVEKAYDKLVATTGISREDAYKKFEEIKTKHEAWDENVEGAVEELKKKVKKQLEEDKRIFEDWVKNEFTIATVERGELREGQAEATVERGELREGQAKVKEEVGEIRTDVDKVKEEQAKEMVKTAKMSDDVEDLKRKAEQEKSLKEGDYKKKPVTDPELDKEPTLQGLEEGGIIVSIADVITTIDDMKTTDVYNTFARQLFTNDDGLVIPHDLLQSGNSTNILCFIINSWLKNDKIDRTYRHLIYCIGSLPNMRRQVTQFRKLRGDDQELPPNLARFERLIHALKELAKNAP